MSDDVDPYLRREQILERLYKDAPYMKADLPTPAAPRPPAKPAVKRGTVSHGTIRAIAAGFAPAIKDFVTEGIQKGVEPLVARLAALEGRLDELEGELKALRDRPHLRRVQ